MQRLAWTLPLVLAAASATLAQQPAPASKLVVDRWDAAYLKNARAGYVHTTIHEVMEDGQKQFKTTVELRLTLKRNQEVIQLRMDTGTVETREGKVTAIFMKQFLGPKKTLELAGNVVGKQLRLVLDQSKLLEPVPWNDNVVGLFAQQRQLREKKLKPGDTFSYLSFESTVNVVLPTHVRVFEVEEEELFAGMQKKKLLRIETRTDKIEKVQMPPLISWLEPDGTVARSQVEVPGLGHVVLYRTNEKFARYLGEPAKLTDIGLSQSVPLGRAIAHPYATTKAVYRIAIRNDYDPASAFSQDDRQTIKNVQGNMLELHVKALAKPTAPAADGEAKVGAEYTESSYFITSDDPLVKKHARNAVGNATDPLQKALLIEKWVNKNMTVKNNEVLATADHVAKHLEGDCTEFAMLMAAMCRAAGVPSRTAVGLVYADVKAGPVFAFHMWTEVFVQGRWYPLDATIAQGKIGATHLKISDQSWHETRTLTPLLPVVRVLGRVSIDVLSVENVLKP